MAKAFQDPNKSFGLNPLDSLINPPVETVTDLQWGRVVTTTPILAVRLDRDAHLGAVGDIVNPSKIVGGLAPNDRVLVLIHENRATILGRGGGSPPPTPPVWQSWTPTLISSPNPFMGNSSMIGRYLVNTGGSVDFTAKIAFGSTFNDNGSGAWSMTLPVPPNVSDGLEWHVGLYVVSSSVLGGIGEGGGYGKIEDGTVTRMFVRRNDVTSVNMGRVAGGVGFARGDRLVVSGTYEMAT